MNTHQKPSAGAMRAATKIIADNPHRMAYSRQELAEIIDSKSGLREMGEALERIAKDQICPPHLWSTAAAALARYHGKEGV